MNLNSIKIRLRNNSPRVHWVKKIIAPKIIRAKPISIRPSSNFEIHALVSKKDFYQLLWALYSFFICNSNDVSLVVHDDGTLSKDHQMILNKLFPGSRMIMRSHADAIMSDKLIDYPKCLNFRSGHPTNLKVLDFWLLAESKNIIFFDSDLIFLEDPKEVFDDQSQSTFLQDIWTNYCISTDRLVKILGYPVKQNVNIGFGCVRTEIFQLDFIESLLGYPEIKNASYIADQTILAAITSKGSLRLLDKQYQMVMSPSFENRTVNHYTSVIRYKFYTEAIPLLFGKLTKNNIMNRLNNYLVNLH
jgi:hypothetical protein